MSSTLAEGTTHPEKTAPRMNVIWLFGDQHRGQAMSCAGDPNVSTPNMDNLTVDGVHFTGAVCGSPLCCPFRGSLIASRYPHHCVPGHEHPLPQDQPTIATAMRGHGYQTAYFGKWHLDGWRERNGRAAFHIVPPERRAGFEYWVAYEHNDSPWDCWVHGENNGKPYHRRLDGWETDCLADELISYLKARGREKRENQDKDKPFFAAWSVQPPHNPYGAPEEWMRRQIPARLTLRPNVPDVKWITERARRGLAGYYAKIENLDWNIGRIVAMLKTEGLYENTVILFFSDHGDMHGSHAQFHKFSPYEESLRILFIIAGGGVPVYSHRTSSHAWSGGFSNALVNHVDIAPTTMGLCNLPKPAWMEGTDYSSHYFRDRPSASEPDSAFIQCVIPTKGLNSVDRPWRGIVTRDGWKYVALEGQPWLLFNLNDDPYELANVALMPEFFQIRKKLQDRLAAWIDTTGDQFTLPELS